MSAAGGVLPGEQGRRRRLVAPALLVLVLGGVYFQTLVPGPGHTPDSAEMEFAAHLLCVTHPTGNPSYLMLGYVFSHVVPFGTPAQRANLLSAVFSVLACLVLLRLLQRLGVRALVAWSVAVAVGLTPTFWRMSVVAEVYSLNLLFLALVTDALLRWRRSLRQRDLLIACALYVAAFGNHLTTALVLPAFVFLVVATRWRVLLEWRLVVSVGGLILLGLLPYAYPLVRSLDPETPYLAQPVTNLAELVAYATGAAFRGSMFAFTAGQLLSERVPMFVRLFWHECAPLIPLAGLGLATLRDRVTSAYLVLVFLAHVVFALGYAIGEIDVFFLPAFFVTAVLAGVGLERIFTARAARRLPAVICLALPLCLCLWNRAEVRSAAVPEKAAQMRQLLVDCRGGALIVARYNDFMQLLYFTLAEKLGGPSVFVGSEIAVPDVIAYVRDDRPVYLAPLRKWAPPGLPVYCTRLDIRPQLRAAGLRVKMVRPGVFRIDRRSVAGSADLARGESE